jgi:hypothetical protein
MVESFQKFYLLGALKKNEGTISRILKRTLKQNYRRSWIFMDLPLPPSRFVVAPTRITREQRKKKIF